MIARRCDIHTWVPVPLECGLYACECGATGYRGSRGKIVAHKVTRKVAVEPTVTQRGTQYTAPTPVPDKGPNVWNDGYRVEPLPALS